MQEEIAAEWWESGLPGQPMPDIRVEGYTTRENHDTVVADCMQERRPPGATYFIQSSPQGWTVTGEFPESEVERLVWVCSAQHPLDPAGDHGLLSYAQLEYAYAWLAERSVPCLQQRGYRIGAAPPWERFARPAMGIADWSPYTGFDSRRTRARPHWPTARHPPVGSNWAPLSGVSATSSSLRCRRRGRR